MKTHLGVLQRLFKALEAWGTCGDAGKNLGEITAYAVYGKLPTKQGDRFLN